MLHVVPGFHPGGAERFAVNLITHLDRDHFEPAVIGLHPATGTDIEARFAVQGIPIWHLGKRLGFDPRTFQAIHRVVSRFRPDVIHTHQHVLPYSLPAMLYHRVPGRVHTVVTLAEREVERSRRWVHRLAFKCGVVPVAVAHEVALSVRRVYGIEDVRMIPNAIPVENYRCSQTSRAPWRARQGFSSTDVLLVCVAGLREEKNHPLLLDAFARFAQANGDAHLIMVGDGEIRPLLQGQIETLNLKDRAHLLGWRSDVPDVLGAADVFVLGSDWEGTPLAVMEAMAAGRPVISTAVGGVPELVQDGVTGLLVPPRDPAAFAAAMRHLADHPDLRHAMGEAAGLQAEKRFGVGSAAESYMRLYESVLAGEGWPAPVSRR